MMLVTVVILVIIAQLIQEILRGVREEVIRESVNKIFTEMKCCSLSSVADAGHF